MMNSVKTYAIPLIAGAMLCLAAGSLFAHHEFASLYDANRIVRQKGVITRLVQLNQLQINQKD